MTSKALEGQQPAIRLISAGWKGERPDYRAPAPSVLQIFVAIQTEGLPMDEVVTVLGSHVELSIAGQFCLDAEKAKGVPPDRFEVQRWTQKGWQETFVYVVGNGWTSVDA